MRKACATIHPFVGTIVFTICTIYGWTVVIHDYLMYLCVSFSWREYYSSCIFQHGHQHRYNYGWRQNILACVKEIGSLPPPCVSLEIIVSAMTCPYCHVLVLQTIGYTVWFAQYCCPRQVFMLNRSPESGGICLWQCIGWYQLLNRVSIHSNFDVPLVVWCRNVLSDVIVDGFYQFVGKWLTKKNLAHNNFYFLVLRTKIQFLYLGLVFTIVSSILVRIKIASQSFFSIFCCLGRAS